MSLIATSDAVGGKLDLGLQGLHGLKSNHELQAVDSEPLNLTEFKCAKSTFAC